MLAEELKRLEQVHKFACTNLKMASKQKERYDVMAKGTPLERGEPVLVYIPQRKKGIYPKLIQPWIGQYLIIKQINDWFTMCSSFLEPSLRSSITTGYGSTLAHPLQPG